MAMGVQGARLLNPSRWMQGASPAIFRRLMRLFPPVRATGIKVDRISDDWLEWDLRLPLTRKTRNYVGTHYGGTLYSAADPHYMLAWMHILGAEYVVWDKAATVRFRKPGRGTLRGEIRIAPEEVADVRLRCAQEPRYDRTYSFAWKDRDGDIVCEIEKILHFRRRA